MSGFSKKNLATFKVPLAVGSAGSQIFKAKHSSFLSWLPLHQDQTRTSKDHREAETLYCLCIQQEQVNSSFKKMNHIHLIEVLTLQNYCSDLLPM